MFKYLKQLFLNLSNFFVKQFRKSIEFFQSSNTVDSMNNTGSMNDTMADILFENIVMKEYIPLLIEKINCDISKNYIKNTSNIKEFANLIYQAIDYVEENNSMGEDEKFITVYIKLHIENNIDRIFEDFNKSDKFIFNTHSLGIQHGSRFLSELKDSLKNNFQNKSVDGKDKIMNDLKAELATKIESRNTKLVDNNDKDMNFTINSSSSLTNTTALGQ